MKIIDATIFFNEIDLLKIRLEMLYEVVDTFLVCESDATFSGNHKPYHLMDRYAELDRFKDKIVYIKYQVPESFLGANNPWQIEAGQRNFLATYLTTLEDDDIAFICDIDELWNPELVDQLKNRAIDLEGSRLRMKFHYYYMNCQGLGSGNTEWTHPFYSNISSIKASQDLHGMRYGRQMGVVNQAGWHFSYLGGAAEIALKIESFSHQEFNNETIKNNERLERYLKLGLDPFDRSDHEWAFRPLDYYPPKLSSIMRSFPHLLRTNLDS